MYIFFFFHVIFQPRIAPPSYEEALSSTLTSLRLSSGYRSLSEERPMGHPSPPPPFRGRNNSSSATAGNGSNFRSFNTRPLTRSSRAEEIPDIYWEQAARELDFCTCRKCQVSVGSFFPWNQFHEFFFNIFMILVLRDHVIVMDRVPETRPGKCCGEMGLGKVFQSGVCRRCCKTLKNH